MARILGFRAFDGGLWVTGPKETAPQGTLRRARGIHHLRMGALFSRFGSTLVFGTGAHSLVRYDDLRFHGFEDKFYRAGLVIRSGLSGNRLAFLKMPPTAGIKDALFVAGGGDLFKVIDAVTQWGITAPTDSSTVTVTTRKAVVGLTGDGFLANPNLCGTAVWNFYDQPADAYSPIPYKAIHVGPDNPCAADAYYRAFTRFQISDLPATTTSALLRVYYISKAAPDQNAILEEINDFGTLDAGDYSLAVRATISATALTTTMGPGQWREFNVTARYNQAKIDGLSHIAFRLRVSDETPVGISVSKWYALAAADHGNDQEPRLIVTGAVSSGFTQADNGAGVLNGVYQYLVTFRNSVTGTRSNANPTAVVTASLTNRQIRLSALPLSTDPQVNQREIWRTVGGGAVFFRVGRIDDNVTLTFDDNVADGDLTSEVLPTDNLPPDDDFDDVAGPLGGRCFWTRDVRVGRRGRVYYSPTGRAEAVEGFIDVTHDDDPTQKVVIWNDFAWVFTEGHVFRLTAGGTVTWAGVAGAPGTTAPHTIVPTPYGIFYQAADAIRLFDGAVSRPIGSEAIHTILVHGASENLARFTGLVAATGHDDEYVISDGAATLALNPAAEVWRDLGIAATALAYEDDTKQVLAAFNGQVQLLEDAGATTDAGTPIPYEVEVPSVITDAEIPGFVRRLTIEATTNGQVLTPTVILDGAEVPLPAFQTTGQQPTEWAIGRAGRVIGVRLTGALTGQVILHAVELDIVLPTASILTGGV